MAELKCPHCGQNFTVDDTELSSIIKQIRDSEFDRDLHDRLKELQSGWEEKQKVQAAQIRLEAQENHDKEMRELKDALEQARNELSTLKERLAGSSNEQKLAVLEAVNRVEEEKRGLEKELVTQKDRYQILLDEKDREVQLYKDMKTRMSTKMVGESLEQHCEIEFNRLRATAFRNAYFEKDNDARTGSKGDYIYRETDENGVELISIMFEMKNEMDTTATKHKNEDFFKELDKDRQEKHCEYAVLVSLLEADNDLYNAGIVDVSWRYDKMYVVRPQCFIPIITVLRNAAFAALEYKQALALEKNQNIDISRFEENLLKFKNDFGRNYEIAHGHFDKAIEEIDKTIQHLEKVKKELLGSDRQLGIANGKVEDITVRRLTKDNPTMQAMFAQQKEEEG
ncbi:MAG: DUF2130 domain-containing protein [Lachnospiraceae bacterium]|nr:DUF2130 domain-containing protein [Lachnospiraceae bacterium]